MEFVEVQKLQETVKIETSFEDIIDIFNNLIKPLCESDDYLVFESIVSPTDMYKYFDVAFAANLNRGERSIQIRLELKYLADAKSFIYQNLVFCELDEDLNELVKNTNLFNYIVSENIKPVAINVYEMDV